MSSRYRMNSTSRHVDLSSVKPNPALKSKYRYMEFKYLYFQIQRLINKEVVISFPKYEQLKQPEIRMSLIKPLVLRIIELSSISTLKGVFTNQLPAALNIYDTPQFAPVGYGSLKVPDIAELRISTNVVYVLLLLRYEYLIQLENNLVMFDLLSTKANVCEVLALRMLREYRSLDRINLLFINPMNYHDEEYEQLKHTKHLDCFNTMELSILSKSKKFLSQPVVVQILDRVYNGELIIKDLHDPLFGAWANLLGPSSSRKQNYDESPKARDYETGSGSSGDSSGEGDCEKNVVNYKFNRITIKKVFVRSHVVPKYQSLVINIKYGVLTLLFLFLVMKHKRDLTRPDSSFGGPLAVLFWMIALSFNFDNIVKLLHIEYRFLKKIVWTYFDLLIVLLIDISFVFKVLYMINKVSAETYYSCFSLIAILLIPRMLSVFNNYEFFNMMIVSLKKMSWNMIAMFCLFISLIFGFFLCFISLTIDLTTGEVAFSMLKLFFGFTPAVWDNWNRYTHLGRGIQLAYLFLIQFVLATILAIVLSNVFAKVSESNKEEFEYLKTTNLIIYLKWGNLHLGSDKKLKVVMAFNYVVNVFKMPIILILYFYEILIKENKMLRQKQQKDLKNFTFLNADDDLYGDQDMMLVGQLNSDDPDVSSLMLKSRRSSHVGPAAVRQFSYESNAAFAEPEDKKPVKLVPQQSHGTLMGFRSGLVDSVFLDDFLGRKYGLGKPKPSAGLRAIRSRSGTITKDKPARRRRLLEQMLEKLEQLERMVELLVRLREDDEFAAKRYGDVYDVAEVLDSGEASDLDATSQLY